jgi:acyl-CoA synthetase (NDP forming)
MLDPRFRPSAVAVIGAFRKELHIGNRIVENLLDSGYTGSIYPINPKADPIPGLRAYKSILDVPTDVDLVHRGLLLPYLHQAVLRFCLNRCLRRSRPGRGRPSWQIGRLAWLNG